MRIIKLSSADTRQVIALEHTIYPPEIAEDEHTIASVLESTDLSRGVMEETLIAQLLVKPGRTYRMDDHDEGIYIYDLCVMPARRGGRACARLLNSLFDDARIRGLDIFFNCRETSYPLVTPSRVEKAGYIITNDVFIPDFYAEWGLDEGAHYVQLSSR